ncbi:hypothetical protein ABZ695_02740 [Streptomyces sp. NPDC006976]|uniref:hypothetical protein n=1 Tax=unclassified Streptomyces TaxID=2593676 RepID=UPI0019276A86|nr:MULTISPECIES: hypothetical protein [unclassified Streptomyces]
MVWIRVTCWCVGLACLYVAIFHTPHNVALMAPLYFLGVFLPGSGESYIQRRRRKGWYAQFSSPEAMRSIVKDEAELRRVRDEKGVLVAARRFRREFPLCPLPEALKMVQSL